MDASKTVTRNELYDTVHRKVGLVPASLRESAKNPKTGVEVIIKPRRVLAFKASPLMKTQMNGKPTPVSDVQRDQANANPNSNSE